MDKNDKYFNIETYYQNMVPMAKLFIALMVMESMNDTGKENNENETNDISCII